MPLIVINLNGRMLTDGQLKVLLNAAFKHMKDGREVMDFEHESLEGRLTRGKEGTYGTFRGTFFTANFGSNNGEPWFVDFLLTRGSEKTVLEDDMVINRIYFHHPDDLIEAELDFYEHSGNPPAIH